MNDALENVDGFGRKIIRMPTIFRKSHDVSKQDRLKGHHVPILVAGVSLVDLIVIVIVVIIIDVACHGLV